MDNKKYLNLDADNSISKKNTIYYNNLNNDKNDDDDDETTQNIPPSILEDQFLKFQKRNHYIKNTLILMDSQNRDITDRHISEYINYEKIAILFSYKESGKFFFTIYNDNLRNEDIIIFESFSFNKGSPTINGINVNTIQYDNIQNGPMYTIRSYTNTEILNILDWNTLFPVVKEIFSSEAQFKSSKDILFHSVSYGSQNVKTDDFILISSKDNTKNVITIKKIKSVIKGYETSSHYKIPLSKKLFNIYKIKLTDINFPKAIFNINNTIFNTGKFKYGVNAYFKVALKSNNFYVSSIDYVSANIDYNYFNKKAIYDKVGAFYDDYTSNNYTQYWGTSIMTVMDNLINNCYNDYTLSLLIKKYGFQTAYYFLFKYVQYNNILYTQPNKYYVITLDFFNDTSDKLILNHNVLNNKMPLLYYNNEIIYVNNDTYKTGIYNINFNDLNYLSNYLKNAKPSDTLPLLLFNLTPNPIVGYISNIVQNIPTGFTFKYNISISPLVQNFNTNDLINSNVYTLSIHGNKIYNNVVKYISYDVSNNFYNYSIEFPYEYELGSWILGNTLYIDTSDSPICTIEKISLYLLIDTTEAVNTDYNNEQILTIVYSNEFIHFTIENLYYEKTLFYDEYLKYIFVVKVVIDKNNNPDYTTNSLFSISLNDLANNLRHEFILNEMNIVVGKFYDFCYNPITYEIIFEKSNDFDNMSYLQKDNIIFKIIYEENPVNEEENFDNQKQNYTYSALTKSVDKTSKHNLETYNTYPIYDYMLPNGLYNESELSQTIENQLNTTKLKIYDHVKKDFVLADYNKTSLNLTEFSQPVFKNVYNPSTREFSISAYKQNNRTKYNAFYNRINPYLFIVANNSIIQNNERIYFNVGEVFDTKLSDFPKYFNKEITTRILPTYTYALRLISPISDNFLNNDTTKEKIYETLDNLLEQIKINPFDLKTSFPNLNTNLKNIGIALINKYNNGNILQSDGTVIEKKGVSCLLNKYELCLCITNIHFNMESYKFGRVCKIYDKTSNNQGNFNVSFQMSGDTSQSFPFYIGDIIYSLESKQFYCIVPNEWGMYMDIPQIAELHNSLPTNDIIRAGYINYLSLLYSYTSRLDLFQMINEFNLHKYNQFSKYTVGDPWRLWFIQEEFNGNHGFEIYFEYNSDIKFNHNQLALTFLHSQDFYMFFEKDKSPVDIMGIDITKTFNVEKFQNTDRTVPFYHTLSNLTNVNIKNITDLYLTYGSDSKLNNKIYLKLDNVTGFNKGDTVYLNNMITEPLFERNVFNIRKTVNHSMNKFINFEMYLNILIYRLAFISLGVPLPNAANDFTILNTDEYIKKDMSAVDYVANEINTLTGLTNTSYYNFIKINYVDNLNNLANDDGTLKNNANITSSELVSTVKIIRDKLLYDKILPWFSNPENLLHFTKGSQSEYFNLLSKYIYFQKNIQRLELTVNEDDLFIFVKDLEIYDEQNLKIGVILDTSLYDAYTPEKGLIYHIYISLDDNYNNDIFTESNVLFKDINNPDDVLEEFNIYSEYYDSVNLKRHYNSMKVKPMIIDSSNEWIYLYDTYLRFKVIITANPNDNLNNNTLDFNIPSSITSNYNNLFNLENKEIDIFKNGYYVYIGPNENFEDATLFNDTYLTLLSMLDNKNILDICKHLEILPNLNTIQTLNSEINKPGIDTSTDEYKLKLSELTSLMKTYVDIIQILVDFPTQHTFMINLNWSNELELGTLDTFKYSIRRMESIYQILGNYNFQIERFSYSKNFIYGKSQGKLDSSNINLYYYNYFDGIVSDQQVNDAYKNNTMSQLCDWNTYFLNNPNFNENDIKLIDHTNILYGVVLYGTNTDTQTGLNTKTIWVLFPKYVYDENLILNNSDLTNFLITINYIFIDQNKQVDVENIEFNQNIDNNIILSAEPEKNSYDGSCYRIFKINFKFTPKYSIKRGLPICIKDYYTTIYKKDEVDIKMKKSYQLYLYKNWTNQIYLTKGTVIHINMGSNNSLYKKYIDKQVQFSNTLNSYEVDNFTNEEINIIESTEEKILENGKTVIQCTMQNSIRFEFAHEIPVIIRYAPYFEQTEEKYIAHNQNSINVSLITTYPILINNEWYTRIYYASSRNLDIFFNNTNGISAFQNNSSREIAIYGMKGYTQPNIGFQKEERTYVFNSSTKEDELDNKFIKPVPNGKYTTVYFQKEDGLDFMEDSMIDLSIGGYYKPVYNMNSPEQNDEWIDNYTNVITIIMKCDKDILEDFKDGSPLYDKNTMILLCRFISLIKMNNLDTDEEYPYNFEFNIELNINYNNFNDYINEDKFNNTIFTDLNRNFYTTIHPDSKNRFPFPKNLTNKSIDYTYVSTLPRHQNNYITIKGKFLGYSGTISLLNNNEIFNQIPYKISDVDTESNNIEIDLELSKDMYSFYYRNNNFMDIETIYNDYINNINYNHKAITTDHINPLFTNFNQVQGVDTTVSSYYNIYPIKFASMYGSLSKNATVFKKKIYKPFSTDVLDYMFICINNIDNDIVVEQQNTIDNKIILAKVYINKQINNIDLQVRHYEIVFDMKLLPSLEELEIIFLDKNGNLVNFNNTDNNFTLEVSQYLERVRNINTKNGMIF